MTAFSARVRMRRARQQIVGDPTARQLDLASDDDAPAAQAKDVNGPHPGGVSREGRTPTAGASEDEGVNDAGELAGNDAQQTKIV